MATDSTTPNQDGEGQNQPGAHAADPKRAVRKKPELPPELDGLLKELAADTSAAGTSTLGRLERRMNILESSFAEMAQKHESALRDRSKQLAVVEQNVLALRNWIDQIDKHHKGAANELRNALGNVSVRLNGLEARGSAVQAPPAQAPAEEVPAAKAPAAESSPPIWTEELPGPAVEQAAAAEADVPQEPQPEPAPFQRSGDVADYLAAARRAANASVGEVHNVQAVEKPPRPSRARALLSGVAATFLVLGGAAFFINRHPVTAKTTPPPAITTPAPKQAAAQQAVQTPLSPPPEVAIDEPADPAPEDVASATPARELQDKATGGDAVASRDLGLKYLTGDGVTVNEDEAARWLLRAAFSGEPSAEYWLGTLYARGRGVPEDESQALHWYEAAAKAGNTQAMHRLGIAYFEGLGVEKNDTEAARWFTQAAEQGNIESAFNLAVLYERGVGVNKSIADAYKWYAMAAHGGDTASAARADVLAKQLPQASLRRP
jgi:localization factor PodJL